MQLKKSINFSFKDTSNKKIKPKGFSRKQIILSWISGAIISALLVTTAMSIIRDVSKKSDVFIVESDVSDMELIPRENWLAQPPVKPLTNLKPVKYVVVGHTNSLTCFTGPRCLKRIRHIQEHDIEIMFYNDISYNFLVGGDGLAYVGRGWDYEGQYAQKHSNNSIGIALIGTFDNLTPIKIQIETTQKLIEMGVKKGKIREDYILLNNGQVSNFESIGDVLYRIIQTWPHWSIENWFGLIRLGLDWPGYTNCGMISYPSGNLLGGFSFGHGYIYEF